MNVSDVKEMQPLLSKIKESMLYLHRVTGKWGLDNIDPMEEKKWSDKCWEHFNVLVEMKCMLCFGKTIRECDEEMVKSWTEADSWVGDVQTGEWKT